MGLELLTILIKLRQNVEDNDTEQMQKPQVKIFFRTRCFLSLPPSGETSSNLLLKICLVIFDIADCLAKLGQVIPRVFLISFTLVNQLSPVLLHISVYVKPMIDELLTSFLRCHSYLIVWIIAFRISGNLPNSPNTASLDDFLCTDSIMRHMRWLIISGTKSSKLVNRFCVDERLLPFSTKGNHTSHA